MTETLLLILLLISSAALSVQIVEESTLSLVVRGWLKMLPYPRSLRALSRFSTWWRITGKFSLILLPFYFVLLAIVNLHLFLSEMLQCSRCTSFHVAWLLLYTVGDYSLIYSLVIAPCAIVLVYVLDILRK
jgi:hypothetical protein